MDMSPSDTPGVEMIFLFTMLDFGFVFWTAPAGECRHTHTLSSLDDSLFFRLILEEKENRMGELDKLMNTGRKTTQKRPTTRQKKGK